MKNIINTIVLSLTLLLGGCDSFLNVNPDDTLMEENSYKSKNEVYANFIGMCSTLGEAAEQALMVAELRSDLMIPTSNAPVKFWEVWRYEAENGNDIVNPAPFYKVIVNANDFIRHTVEYYRNHQETLDKTLYKGMLGVALSNRAWAYLNIGKFYGEAVYYDWSLGSDIDLSKQRVLKLDELIDELIYSLKNGVEGVDAFTPIKMKDILNKDSEAYNSMFVNADALLGELYMWKGSYADAARQLTNTVAGLGVSSTNYTLGAKFNNGLWMGIFMQSYGVAGEAVSAVPYDYEKEQTNNLQYYFSNNIPNVYYFKPSDSLIYQYENTICLNKNIGDIYRGNSVTYAEINNEKVILKYDLVSGYPYEHDAAIYIYRAADLWLMLAESLSALGDIAAADSLLNTGMKTSYKNNKWLAPFDSPIYAVNSNVLKDSEGIRSRAGVRPNYLKYYVSADAPLARKQFVMDSLIAAEVSLESAFEGKRWFALMRMARNTNQPEKLADQICKKFPQGEQEQYRQYLMNPKNWFIKYDQLNVVNKKTD